MQCIALDTHVLVASLRSRRGASSALLDAVGTGRFEHVVSVPLVMEHESVLVQPGMVPLGAEAVHDVRDHLCATAIRQDVHFPWRSRLPDPVDDMVLEAAVHGGCSMLVTHHIRDFAGADALGVRPCTPAQCLAALKA